MKQENLPEYIAGIATDKSAIKQRRELIVNTYKKLLGDFTR
jgi:hypothetical protein